VHTSTKISASIEIEKLKTSPHLASLPASLIVPWRCHFQRLRLAIRWPGIANGTHMCLGHLEKTPPVAGKLALTLVDPGLLLGCAHSNHCVGVLFPEHFGVTKPRPFSHCCNIQNQTPVRDSPSHVEALAKKLAIEMSYPSIIHKTWFAVKQVCTFTTFTTKRFVFYRRCSPQSTVQYEYTSRSKDIQISPRALNTCYGQLPRWHHDTFSPVNKKGF